MHLIFVSGPYSGKLVYAPNTPAFARLIEKVNETLQDIRAIQDLSNAWLEVSPNITLVLSRLEDTITEAVDTFQNCSGLITTLENALERIKM